jgi:hypothetical protein
MTADAFRRLALELPEAVESSHMSHPDFRVRKKIFATLGYPDREWAMVKLSPQDQETFSKSEPKAFVPVEGSWGRQGATNVRLKAARNAIVRSALLAAWRNTAPKNLARQF